MGKIGLLLVVLSWSAGASSLEGCVDSFQSMVLAQQAAVLKAKDAIYALDRKKVYTIHVDDKSEIVEVVDGKRTVKWTACYKVDPQPLPIKIEPGVNHDGHSYCTDFHLENRREKLNNVGSGLILAKGINWKVPQKIQIKTYAAPYVGELQYSMPYDCGMVLLEPVPHDKIYKLGCTHGVGKLGDLIETAVQNGVGYMHPSYKDVLELEITAAASTIDPDRLEFKVCLNSVE